MYLQSAKAWPSETQHVTEHARQACTHLVRAALLVTVHTAWWLGPNRICSCPHGLQAKQTKLPYEALEGALTQQQSELMESMRAHQRSQAQLAQADALAEKAVWVIAKE